MTIAPLEDEVSTFFLDSGIGWPYFSHFEAGMAPCFPAVFIS
jgi:hypothetical protein